MTDVESPAVREQLEQIVTSEAFRKSKRARDLLTYLVTRSLDDPHCNLDGYNIALDVFGKDGHFDPGQNSTVRVQMGRLRQLLTVFYETGMEESKIYIAIPKGTNRPVFSLIQHSPAETVSVEAAMPDSLNANTGSHTDPQLDPQLDPMTKSPPAGEGKARASKATILRAGLAFAVILMLGVIIVLDRFMNMSVQPSALPSVSDSIAIDGGQQQGQPLEDGTELRPIILVKDFENYSQNISLTSVAKRIELELTSNLSNFQLLETKKFPDKPIESEAYDNAYSLKGAVFANQDTMTLTLVLSHLSDAEVIWSKTYQLAQTVNGTLQHPEDYARMTAAQIGGLAGPVHSHSLKHLRRQPANTQTINQYVYICTVELAKLDIIGAARNTQKYSACAERLAAVKAPSSLVLSALSQYELLLAYASTEKVVRRKATKRALKYALHATEYQSDNDIAYRALATAQALRGNIPAATYAYQRAVSINPADSDNKASLGTHLCFNGQWDEGITFIQEAMRESPASPLWYQRALALYYYHNKNYEQALEAALVRLDVEPAFTLPIVLSAAIQLDARSVVDEYKTDYEKQYKENKGDLLLPLRQYVQDKNIIKALEGDIEQVRDLFDTKEG